MRERERAKTERITGASTGMTERPVIAELPPLARSLARGLVNSRLTPRSPSNISNSSHLQWALLVGKPGVILQRAEVRRSGSERIHHAMSTRLSSAGCVAAPGKYWPTGKSVAPPWPRQHPRAILEPSSSLRRRPESDA
jgi:hypothetical protein